MRINILKTGALALLLVATGAVAAQEFTAPELRAGIFAHSVDQWDAWRFDRVEDFNVELLAGVPWIDDLVPVGQLRPHVGATVNFGGLESMAYAGMSYTLGIFDTPLFIEGSLGAAIHNGQTFGATAPSRSLGCQVLFRESFSLGANVTEDVTVMATIEHASHALLCGPENPGLTNLGVRVGYRF